MLIRRISYGWPHTSAEEAFSWLVITGNFFFIYLLLVSSVSQSVQFLYCQWKSIALWVSKGMDIDFCLLFYLYLCSHVSVLCIAVCDDAHTDFRGDNVPRIARSVWSNGMGVVYRECICSTLDKLISFSLSEMPHTFLLFTGSRLKRSCSLPVSDMNSCLKYADKFNKLKV